MGTMYLHRPLSDSFVWHEDSAALAWSVLHLRANGLKTSQTSPFSGMLAIAQCCAAYVNTRAVIDVNVTDRSPGAGPPQIVTNSLVSC